MPLVLIKKLRLLGIYLLRFLNGFIPPLLSVCPGYIRLRLGTALFVGTRVQSEWFEEVLEDLRHSAVDLYSTLATNRRLVFCCLPTGIAENATAPPFFFLGSNLLAWEKTGLLAHCVWIAFKIRAGLDDPAASLDDWYGGQPRLKFAAMQTVQWLTKHDQPEEMIEFHRTFADSIPLHPKK